MTSFASTFSVPASHPSLPGHFPGRPVVPGAVTLSEVLAAWQSHSRARIVGMSNIKFLSPLLPDEDAKISFIDRGKGLIAFEIAVDSRRVVSGTLRCTDE